MEVRGLSKDDAIKDAEDLIKSFVLGFEENDLTFEDSLVCIRYFSEVLLLSAEILAAMLGKNKGTIKH